MAKTPERYIPIGEGSAEVLMLITKFPALRWFFEDSVIRNRQVGQIPNELLALVETDFVAVRKEAAALSERLKEGTDISSWRHHIANNPPSADVIAYLIVLHEKEATEQEGTRQQQAKSIASLKAANALHSKPGGNLEKQSAIRKVWASGKYSNRDLCAEQECAALDMSFSAARKALRNTPAPPSRCTA